MGKHGLRDLVLTSAVPWRPSTRHDTRATRNANKCRFRAEQEPLPETSEDTPARPGSDSRGTCSLASEVVHKCQQDLCAEPGLPLLFGRRTEHIVSVGGARPIPAACRSHACVQQWAGLFMASMILSLDGQQPEGEVQHKSALHIGRRRIAAARTLQTSQVYP